MQRCLAVSRQLLVEWIKFTQKYSHMKLSFSLKRKDYFFLITYCILISNLSSLISVWYLLSCTGAVCTDYVNGHNQFVLIMSIELQLDWDTQTSSS